MSSHLMTVWRQYRLERKMFWRNPSAAFFNFIFPLILLSVFGAVFSSDKETLQVIVPGIAGMSVMATTFSAFAFQLTFLREKGILKRIRGTPLSGGSYIAGLAMSAATNALVQIAIITFAGRAVFGIGWPENLLELILFVALGVVCFASLGIALSHAIPNFDSAPAYVNAVFLPMIFISGVFYDADDAPRLIKDIAEVMPLKHLIDGLSSAMVSGEGTTSNLVSLLAIAGWTAVGLTLAIRGFAWEAKRQ